MPQPGKKSRDAVALYDLWQKECNENAALRAEVARLTKERDDWMARAHTYDVERQQYHAELADAQARLAALIAKVELWVDADGEVREALAAAQSGEQSDKAPLAHSDRGLGVGTRGNSPGRAQSGDGRKATAPADAALRRVVEAARWYREDDWREPDEAAEELDAALRALDAADPAPAETGDDGEAGR